MRPQTVHGRHLSMIHFMLPDWGSEFGLRFDVIFAFGPRRDYSKGRECFVRQTVSVPLFYFCQYAVLRRRHFL